MRGLRTLLGIAVVAAGLTGPLATRAFAADTYSVSPGTADASATSCSGSAPTFSCPNLRSAVAAAEADNGSTIQLSAGAYALSISRLLIDPGTNTLTITGPGASQTTIQQTASGHRVLLVNSGTVAISGVTIAGGTITGPTNSCPGSGWASGGGILNAGTLTLSGVTVTGNSVTGSAGAAGNPAGGGTPVAGGGLCSTGSLTLDGTTVSGNTVTAGEGGAGTGTAAGGRGGDADGGGVYASGPLIVKNHSVIEGNHVVGGRGGDGGTSGTTADGGQGGAALGGGIKALDALTMTDSTVTANTMTGGDGGNTSHGDGLIAGPAVGSVSIGPTAAAATITSSQITNETAVGGNGGQASGTGGEGGGAGAGLTTDAPLTVTGTTVSGNTATGGAAGASGSATKAPSGDAESAGIDAGGALKLLTSTVANNHATAGPTGTTTNQGGNAFAGGLVIRATTTIVNTTITGNTANADMNGTAIGGGIDDRGGSTRPMTLQSVTLVGNSASSATPSAGNGGNLYVLSGGVGSIADTIISGGSSSSTSSPRPNCDGTVTDGGHNLESTTPSQCGFSAANGDQLGSDPLLGSLASNGGPTQTMALGVGSPAIHAGGQCTDPTNGGAPLQTDQRGRPRHNPCDIGAFETQPPGGAPTVTGAVGLGQTLTCSTASITSDGPLSISSFQWLRNGVAVSGAASSTYKVAKPDVGHQLACRVTAMDPFGSATLTSPSVMVPPAPKISGLKQSHKHWRRGGKLATIARTRAPVGDTFKFKLSADAKLTLTFTHKLHGRKRTAGKITFKSAHAGKRKVKFQGRLSRHKKLKPGTYILKITATNPSGHSTSRGIKFTIVA